MPSAKGLRAARWSGGECVKRNRGGTEPAECLGAREVAREVGEYAKGMRQC
jgi:hypothetical protein